MDFINGFKTMLVGILTVVTTTVAPFVPASSVTALPSPLATPEVQSSAQNTSPAPTATPLDADHYYYINGTYSYLGQSIKYFLLVPKAGGSFNGAISGACEAQVGASYAGGEGGKISGSATGKCNLLFVKYQGSIPFEGNLYPEEKKIVVELKGAHLPPITLNYN